MNTNSKNFNNPLAKEILALIENEIDEDNEDLKSLLVKLHKENKDVFQELVRQRIELRPIVKTLLDEVFF